MAGIETPTLSKNAQKREARKQAKAARIALSVSHMLAETSTAGGEEGNLMKATHITVNQAGNKSWQARQALKKQSIPHHQEKCVEDADCSDTHRSSDASADTAALQEVVERLEGLERAARLLHRQHMLERKYVATDVHGTMLEEKDINEEEQYDSAYATARQDIPSFNTQSKSCSFRNCQLEFFSLSLMQQQLQPSVSPIMLMELNLSSNKLWELPPDLSCLNQLETLDLSRNWFQIIPAASLTTLKQLTYLNMSNNILDGLLYDKSLQLSILKTCPKLAVLDLSLNKRCGHQDTYNRILQEMPQLQTLHMTITCPRPPGTLVGASPAERDATLLRSQLEPWSTSFLRKRLVADFGQPVPPLEQNRSEIMQQLLQCYQEEGQLLERATIIHTEGTCISEDLAQELLVALREWSGAAMGGNQERKSIQAENYMILSAPHTHLQELQKDTRSSSKKAGNHAYKELFKLHTHKRIWQLAHEAIRSVDPHFEYTALAVTHNFQGSPHIDRQNSGPFYGLALGNFQDGAGRLCVECSARVVAMVNTKHRLAKVDGRHPHWVAPYDNIDEERYSLIYYQTVGQRQAVGPAIFHLPQTTI